MENSEKKEVRLERDFFMRDALTLAQELLGKVMVHNTPCGKVRGIITETEAYMGVNDKGSHTYGGKRTERTEPMFHIGGTSYVYLIYGMYSCMNVTSNESDVPQAVLIRMVEPADEESERIMLKFRLIDQEARAARRNVRKENGESTSATEKNARKKALAQEKNLKKHLADGPGRLCIAMDISRADNDVDMVESDTFYLTEGVEIAPENIEAGKRIGIDYAEEAADFLWRFTVKRLKR